MKRFVIASLLLVTCYLPANAQEKKATEPPARVEAAPDIQNAFVLSQSRIATAEANLRAARAEQDALVLRAMLTLGLSVEYEASIDGKGKLVFEKTPEVKVGSEASKDPPKK